MTCRGHCRAAQYRQQCFLPKLLQAQKTYVKNSLDMSIRKEGVFDGIVPIEVFMTAQQIITGCSQRLSDEELLEHLSRLYARAGELSGFLIDQTGDMPSAAAYRCRFGSLGRAYELIGCRANLNREQTGFNRRLRAMHPEIIYRTQAAIAEAGGAVECDSKTDLLRINGELAISLVLTRCQTLDDARHRCVAEILSRGRQKALCESDAIT